MELWIRNQSKEELIKVETLFIELEISDEKEFWKIRTTKDKTHYSLGYYNSKERALEVLDEIQKTFEPKILLDSKSIKQNNIYEQNGVIYANYNANARFEQLNTVVYQMPEE